MNISVLNYDNQPNKVAITQLRLLSHNNETEHLNKVIKSRYLLANDKQNEIQSRLVWHIDKPANYTSLQTTEHKLYYKKSEINAVSLFQ